MSTKSSIFLTEDNEHCYYELNNPVSNGREFEGYEIVIELDRKHVEITQDQWDVFVTLKDPNSQIYKLIQLLKDKESEIYQTKK